MSCGMSYFEDHDLNFDPKRICEAVLAVTTVAVVNERAAQDDNGPYYYLQTQVISGDDSKDGLYVLSYHTGAAISDATLSSEPQDSFNGFFNQTSTSQQFDWDIYPWGMHLQEYAGYHRWHSVEIDIGYGDSGFSLGDSGLVAEGKYWLDRDGCRQRDGLSYREFRNERKTSTHLISRMGSTSEYDFIIVGGGPSGCVVASRLAHTARKPSVLLLEAGGPNKNAEYLIPAERFSLAFSQPSLNWGYKTAPQSHLKGQQIDYSRGKGLGGSTAINFGCWIIGADEDFEEWARMVGDEAWRWERVKERIKKIESYHVEVPEKYRQFIDPKPEDHGTSGPLHLSYADSWERGIEDIFIAAEETGMGVNNDVNNGNPIGMGMGAGCMYQGVRTTASAYLENAPSNLTIMTNSPIAKVILSEDKTAKGVQTIEGQEYYAKKEVILSAGALNTPQILMLSGIGPKAELEKYSILLVHELPGIGQNLQDHAFCGVSLILKEGYNDRMKYESDPEAVKAAKEQHNKDKTGLLCSLYCSNPMGWFKNERVFDSEEFKALDQHTQERLRKPTVPTFEITTHTPPLFLGDYTLRPTDCYVAGIAFVMNPQSYGSVTLASANPSDSPIIDPKIVSHPYDRRVMIEGLRQMMDLLEAPVFKKETVKMVGCPKGRSDEEIWLSAITVFTEDDDFKKLLGDFEVSTISYLQTLLQALALNWYSLALENGCYEFVLARSAGMKSKPNLHINTTKDIFANM
ncbi:hypothetical protein G7Y89_g8033 [Cudoniella acicularis]|uniref:Glucose-methanol-choline oxidoreductase N-terminal domain-containing protein n=1 Tax=Cudoniella acicularis TaxID=354080 RepID=A0A8H4W385_9HELO|nr:hypothetical protein G7Y89_g8033 [Cudoniella acicularis]